MTSSTPSTLPAPRVTEKLLGYVPSAAGDVKPLSHAVMDLRLEIEVASSEAFYDGELRGEDPQALDQIGELQDRARASHLEVLDQAERHLLADIDERLESLRGQAEILQLAVTWDEAGPAT